MVCYRRVSVVPGTQLGSGRKVMTKKSGNPPPKKAPRPWADGRRRETRPPAAEGELLHATSHTQGYGCHGSVVRVQAEALASAAVSWRQPDTCSWPPVRRRQEEDGWGRGEDAGVVGDCPHVAASWRCTAAAIGERRPAPTAQSLVAAAHRLGVNCTLKHATVSWWLHCESSQGRTSRGCRGAAGGVTRLP